MYIVGCRIRAALIPKEDLRAKGCSYQFLEQIGQHEISTISLGVSDSHPWDIWTLLRDYSSKVHYREDYEARRESPCDLSVCCDALRGTPFENQQQFFQPLPLGTRDYEEAAKAAYLRLIDRSNLPKNVEFLYEELPTNFANFDIPIDDVFGSVLFINWNFVYREVRKIRSESRYSEIINQEKEDITQTQATEIWNWLCDSGTWIPHATRTVACSCMELLSENDQKYRINDFSCEIIQGEFFIESIEIAPLSLTYAYMIIKKKNSEERLTVNLIPEGYDGRLDVFQADIDKICEAFRNDSYLKMEIIRAGEVFNLWSIMA